VPDSVTVFAHDPAILNEALAGLTATPKTLPPKLFYDARGVALFQRITELPEYYPTRTERALLRDCAADIAARLPKTPACLVEYGASHEDKAELLMRICPIRRYVPIDVARSALQEIVVRMRQNHSDVEVAPIQSDFMAPLALADSGLARIGFFPGSTIGNLEPQDAIAFLRGVRATLGAGAVFLVGADLPKEPAILRAAYNDRQGVTAAFNLNLLQRLNREAGADFDLGGFSHRAIWNAAKSRIEMHLVSQRPQTVHLGGHSVRFAREETIHTENSYKHSAGDFQILATRSGWHPVNVWTDHDQLFSMHLLAAGE
jgi:dimethylhistidine N-methyltransferase